MLQRATLRRPAQPGTARSPGTGTWPTRGPAARAPDCRSLTPRIAHRHGAAANKPTWPDVTIGVPGAATASRHGNPKRRSTPGHRHAAAALTRPQAGKDAIAGAREQAARELAAVRAACQAQAEAARELAGAAAARAERAEAALDAERAERRALTGKLTAAAVPPQPARTRTTPEKQP